MPHRPRYRRNPSAMPAATVLYRSVSLPEFVHVMQTGKFSGGANSFNPFDRRKLVFFGDELSDDLIFQGEEIERQADYALREDPIHAEHAAAKQIAENEARPWSTRRKFAATARKLQERYLKKHQRVSRSIRSKLSKLPLSSVVFETIPLIGAEMYGKGETGFGDREYGFPSNDVNIYDVERVWIVKAGKITGSITVLEAKELARRLETKLW